jgi:hypothetical protein
LPRPEKLVVAAEKVTFFIIPTKKEIYLLIPFKFNSLRWKLMVVSEQQLSRPRHLTLGAESR